MPVIYCNITGAQDSIVFDGSSFAVDEFGELIGCLPSFEDCVKPIKACKSESSEIEDKYKAITIGLRDYIHKNSARSVVIGLSGGIDSALVAVLAIKALGKNNVRLVFMPSEFTSEESKKDAKALAKNLGVKLEEIDIGEIFVTLKSSLKAAFKGKKADTAEENMQARIRANILMSISNKFGCLLLSTGNKSEVAVGYSTLYGDSCGAFNPIKDLYKTEVYKMARWINKTTVELIPTNIIKKEPTAELRDNQKDSDSLPDYELLDKFLQQFVEQRKSVNKIRVKGLGIAEIEALAEKVQKAEYKRQQSPMGVKLSKVSFDDDWKLPVTNKYWK